MLVLGNDDVRKVFSVSECMHALEAVTERAAYRCKATAFCASFITSPMPT